MIHVFWEGRRTGREQEQRTEEKERRTEQERRKEKRREKDKRVVGSNAYSSFPPAVCCVQPFHMIAASLNAFYTFYLQQLLPENNPTPTIIVYNQPLPRNITTQVQHGTTLRVPSFLCAISSLCFHCLLCTKLF